MNDEQNRELDAWHAVCQELRDLGINVNEDRYDNLVHAIRLWGEELTRLGNPARLDRARRRYPQVAQQALRFRDRYEASP